eukprot:TRINITY_DN19064_c0_g3_i1.p1 TRINITY_DN19064_c0_g3~~TRINITY_DN19064_c0_g3_i1.p1  ORF type:complete len:480 (+),score=71.92 TRINITY_DN19064_c0_g3_i1:62-1501(+)
MCSVLLPRAAVAKGHTVETVSGNAREPDCESPFARWLERPLTQFAQPQCYGPPGGCGMHAAHAAVAEGETSWPSSSPGMLSHLHGPLQTPVAMQQAMHPVACVPVSPGQLPACVYYVPIAGVMPVPATAVAAAAPLTAPSEPFVYSGANGARAGDKPGTGSGRNASFAEATKEQNFGKMSQRAELEESQSAASASKQTPSAARRRRRHLAAAYARTERLQQVMLGGQGRVNLTPPESPRLPVTDSCLKLSKALLSGGEERRQSLLLLSTSVRTFAFDREGCRVLQSAIERCDPRDVECLLEELHGSVKRAIACPNANHVIQKIIEVMPAQYSQFIAKELRGQAVKTARHRFGCRILCRLLERTMSDPHTMDLLEELMTDVGNLTRHEYGHYVIEALVEHGVQAHKKQIVVSLEKELSQNLHSKNALFVLDRAVKYCKGKERARLGNALQYHPETAKVLVHPVLGPHVLRIFSQIEKAAV